MFVKTLKLMSGHAGAEKAAREAMTPALKAQSEAIARNAERNMAGSLAAGNGQLVRKTIFGNFKPITIDDILQRDGRRVFAQYVNGNTRKLTSNDISFLREGVRQRDANIFGASQRLQFLDYPALRAQQSALDYGIIGFSRRHPWGTALPTGGALGWTVNSAVGDDD